MLMAKSRRVMLRRHQPRERRGAGVRPRGLQEPCAKPQRVQPSVSGGALTPDPGIRVGRQGRCRRTGERPTPVAQRLQGADWTRPGRARHSGGRLIAAGMMI